ncbi:hypothetical protein [Limnothrix redekei]|uniref:DUF1515 domain-containing protein n=1 Tax=Limnothrix redekei LRLZ20PSL1 TaxID=3112953 RepID=A0ABW7C577_9CYAN
MDVLESLQDRLRHLEQTVNQGDRQILMELGSIREKLGAVVGLTDQVGDIDVRVSAIEQLLARAGETGLVLAARAARAAQAMPGGWRGWGFLILVSAIAVDLLVDLLGWGELLRAIAHRLF